MYILGSTSLCCEDGDLREGPSRARSRVLSQGAALGHRGAAPVCRGSAWAAEATAAWHPVARPRCAWLTSLQFSELEKWMRSSLYISWVLMMSLYSFWLRSSGLMPLARRNSW